MNKGLLYSGVGHSGLILWALLGGWLNLESMTPAVQVAQVSIITTTEFNAMQSAAPKVTNTAPKPAPQPATSKTPKTPKPDVPKPDAPKPDAALATPPKKPATKPPVKPDPTPVPDPSPAPDPATPQPTPVTPPADTPQPVPVPPSDQKPAPHPADRIAATPVAPSDQPKTADTPAPAQTDTPSPDATPAPVKPPAAPPATVTAVTPDAKPAPDNAPTLAPTASPRPPSRPKAAVQSADQPADTTAPAAAPSAIDAALATATAAAPPATATATTTTTATAAKPSQAGTGGTGDQALGPTLNAGEMDNLHHSIAQKWNIGALSTEAAKVIIVVDVTLTQDQKPQAIKMLSFTGGSDAAAQLAFTAARSAIYRAAAEGLNLPADKYDNWKDLEITFDPSTGRLR